MYRAENIIQSVQFTVGFDRPEYNARSKIQQDYLKRVQIDLRKSQKNILSLFHNRFTVCFTIVV